MPSGKLILCGTPIGNLEDATPRLIAELERADVIACEDTRRTRKLLSHFGIAARDLVVHNEANERREVPRLVERLRSGARIALVSDAGMPGLSDPGYRLVRACIEAGIEVDVAPGPSAAITALAVSGLPPGRFVFEGFLPRKQGERRRRLEELASEPRTLVFFESPHRAASALADLADVLGPRPAVVARELTKLHQEILHRPLDELAAWAASEPPRGEITLVVAGHTAQEQGVSAAELARAARALMDAGVERKEALQRVARDYDVPKRKVFDALLEE